jgi:glycolate oxidase iron-sulfur subunit
MRYGRLVDIGRGLMERQVPRSAYSKGLRWLLRAVLSRPRLFAAALAVGQAVRPILPKILRDKVPLRQTRKPLLTGTGQHPRQMLILEGCAQSAATPNTNDAARRVLDRLGITLITAPGAGCCGAVNYHLGAHDDGLDNMRRNIDAWWPYIESDAEAIVNSASGCGSMLVEYAELLAHDPAYAHKAKRISQLTRDIGEVLLEEDLGELAINNAIGKIAVHTPCTLQHALGLPDLVPDLLGRAGFELAQTTDKHLCCGSAGTYSILQASTSQRLRDNKLRALTGDAPTLIATANVGCQLHMQGAAGIPVVHWIELLDTKN